MRCTAEEWKSPRHHDCMGSNRPPSPRAPSCSSLCCEKTHNDDRLQQPLQAFELEFSSPRIQALPCLVPANIGAFIERNRVEETVGVLVKIVNCEQRKTSSKLARPSARRRSSPIRNTFHFAVTTRVTRHRERKFQSDGRFQLNWDESNAAKVVAFLDNEMTEPLLF